MPWQKARECSSGVGEHWMFSSPRVDYHLLAVLATSLKNIEGRVKGL